jgi:hypothetical protein
MMEGICSAMTGRYYGEKVCIHPKKYASRHLCKGGYVRNIQECLRYYNDLAYRFHGLGHFINCDFIRFPSPFLSVQRVFEGAPVLLDPFLNGRLPKKA